MSEVVVRRRVGRRSGDWKYRLTRWFHRHRPKVAVLAAFTAACLLGLIAAAAGVSRLGEPGQAPAAQSR